MAKEKKKDLFFRDQFLIKLDDWKTKRKAEGKDFSDQAFADEVGVSRGSVANWKKGELPGTYNMEELCSILGVSDSYFQITSVEDMLKYSQEFITSEIGKRLVEKAKEIELDIDLVKTFSKIIDFDQLFPVYQPIVDRRGDEYSGREYARTENEEWAPMDESLQFLQVFQDGQIKTFSSIDLIYLKEVQDQVVDFVEYLFYKRSKEMEEEVRAFNDDMVFNAKLSNGRIITAWKKVTPETYRKYDRFAKYLLFEKEEDQDDGSESDS